MASSDNLASIDPWTFRPSFADPWLCEAFSRDTETLTKALQKSFSASETLSSNSISPFLDLLKPDTAVTQTVSNVSASDPETAPKRNRNLIPLANGKVSKRKSRASKRSQTTFIAADPANFRQMVQQVTGVRFGGGQVPLAPILKPEPQRPGNRLQSNGGSCLPTLDTSAFLLDHQQQSMDMGPSPSAAGLDPFSSLERGIVGNGGLVDVGSFGRFPTLESWKVL